MSTPKERLADVARTLRAGEPVPAVTVRSFLSWFWSTQRRGRWIVSYIRESLQELGLRTVPDFESTYLDAEMHFELAAPATDTGDSIRAPDSGPGDDGSVRPVAASFADPTYRISKLAAANKSPVAVRPDSTMLQTVTLMMANDFSQLPVMTGERDVKGIVSWKSIGSRLALGQAPQAARDVMEPHAEVSSDASLFAAIPTIVESEYALVRGADQRIVGIITTTDLSLQFQQLSEPFLLLGEIENHIRRMIGSRFTAHELGEAKDPAGGARSLEGASDLTFGECKRLLEEPSRWAKLGLNIDRTVFVRILDRVREIRNDVMHFDPDGIDEEALDALRGFAGFLRSLQTVGAT